MTVSYCIKCEKEVDDEIKQCKCGCKMFVYGNRGEFSIDDEGNVICKCGSKKFKRNMHLDYTGKAVNNYTCMECGTPVSTESYRDEEEEI
jgi:hypothetical protein